MVLAFPRHRCRAPMAWTLRLPSFKWLYLKNAKNFSKPEPTERYPTLNWFWRDISTLWFSNTSSNFCARCVFCCVLPHIVWSLWPRDQDRMKAEVTSFRLSTHTIQSCPCESFQVGFTACLVFANGNILAELATLHILYHDFHSPCSRGNTSEKKIREIYS